MTTTTTTREVDGFDLRDGMRLLGADDHVWILSDVFHSPNLGNGVHEATAPREDNPSQSWPVRLSNVQAGQYEARASRYTLEIGAAMSEQTWAVALTSKASGRTIVHGGMPERAARMHARNMSDAAARGMSWVAGWSRVEVGPECSECGAPSVEASAASWEDVLGTVTGWTCSSRCALERGARAVLEEVVA